MESQRILLDDFHGLQLFQFGLFRKLDVHLGNCRTFVSFDLIFRYLTHLGYKVRYVRNITDAGHLEGDNDEGDDKFAED